MWTADGVTTAGADPLPTSGTPSAAARLAMTASGSRASGVQPMLSWKATSTDGPIFGKIYCILVV